MSRPLDLDFLREPGRARSLPWILLAAGILAASAAFLSYRHAATEVAGLETRIADARRAAGPGRGPVALGPAQQKLLAEEIRFANALLVKMNFPWDQLFGELERAHVEGVTLLGVQPDVDTGRVTLAGEARTYELALAYVASLERTDRLSGVYLTSHETRSSGASRPVVFSLSAEWRSKP
jgi:hypothetical protein